VALLSTKKNLPPAPIPSNLANAVPTKLIKPSNRDYDILSNQLTSLKVSSDHHVTTQQLSNQKLNTGNSQYSERSTPQQTLKPRDYNIINNQYFEGDDKNRDF